MSQLTSKRVGALVLLRFETSPLLHYLRSFPITVCYNAQRKCFLTIILKNANVLSFILFKTIMRLRLEPSRSVLKIV